MDGKKESAIVVQQPAPMMVMLPYSGEHKHLLQIVILQKHSMISIKAARASAVSL